MKQDRKYKIKWEPVNTLKDASNFKLRNIRKNLKDNVKAHAKKLQ